MSDKVTKALLFQLPFPFVRRHPLTTAKLADADFYHHPNRTLPDRAVEGVEEGGWVHDCGEGTVDDSIN